MVRKGGYVNSERKQAKLDAAPLPEGRDDLIPAEPWFLKRRGDLVHYERFGNTAVLIAPTAEAVDGMRVPTRYNFRRYTWPKRVLDLTLGTIALLIFFPLAVLISLLILVTEGWPVVFKQRRLGQDGKEFYIYKFRTMVRNAEEILKSRPELMEEYRRTYKITNDPRISRVGKLLRKTSADELPQLFNVLAGDMSLVGPRPIVPAEIEKYGEYDFVYKAMKPGCAGLWQCSGRSDISYHERVQLDVHYFENAGVFYDLWILARTAWDVIRCRGAN